MISIWRSKSTDKKISQIKKKNSKHKFMFFSLISVDERGRWEALKWGWGTTKWGEVASKWDGRTLC